MNERLVIGSNYRMPMSAMLAEAAGSFAPVFGRTVAISIHLKADIAGIKMYAWAERFKLLVTTRSYSPLVP